MYKVKKSLLNRFVKYVQINTAADTSAKSYPSSSSQTYFNQIIASELTEIGLTDVCIDQNSLLTATIPPHPDYTHLPVIGFIAHVDTSPDAPGENVRPLIHHNYNGQDINLPAGKTLSVKQFPELNKFIGHTLITSSGDTLLGADDKAGVAEIVTAAQYLIQNPQIPHGKIRIAFTCDEEIGRGTDRFPIDTFGAKFAYTMDSGDIGLLEYENFNAATAIIKIIGRNIHPGYAHGRMINAIELAHEIHAALPSGSKPENTKDREGFYHLTSISGNVTETNANYIIREFDDTKFVKMQDLLTDIAAQINARFDYDPISVVFTEQYRNMRRFIEPMPEVIERARRAIRSVGLEPLEHPIRGGTDGARLSCNGLPCPNIFTGGMNFHSTLEYASLDGMELAVRVIIAIASQI